MRLRAINYGDDIAIVLDAIDSDDYITICREPTFELAKQEAIKVLGDLQLKLLTLEVEK